MSRLLTSALAILAIAAVGVPLWIFVIDVESAPPPAPPRRVGPSLVETRTLEREDFVKELEVYGTLVEARRAVLAVERSGAVTWVLDSWRPGLRVGEGEVLLAIDEEPYRLELERAEALRAEARAGQAAAESDLEWARMVDERALESLDIARRELERLESLERNGRVSASVVDQARAALLGAEVEVENARGRVRTSGVALTAAKTRLAQAEAAVSLAQSSLERTRVTAPFEGRLEGRSPAVGSFLVAGTPVAQCLDVSTLHLVAKVHADRLRGVREGGRAALHLPSRPDLRLEGRVSAVSPVVDPLTRSASVEIEFQNEAGDTAEGGERGLPVGLFARATLQAGLRPDVLWLDRRHLVWRGGEPVAWILDDRGEARSRVLELGETLGEGFEVRAGLEAGEVLITRPLDRLVEGAECEPLTAAGGARER